jgi:hypothetical protein
LLGNVAAAAAAADSRQEFALVLGFSPMVFNQYEESLNMIIPKLKIPLNRCFLNSHLLYPPWVILNI